jgi:sugar/nucleoside kinase (ribokinase family)
MALLVVGSMALDSVKTPFGTADDALGGSATYFSTSSSYFTDVRLVAVVGEDFPERHVNFLKMRNVDIQGLEHAKGKTFRWKGEYGYDLNEARTLDTQLNVFQDFKPKLPAEYKTSPVVFLANIDPDLQREVLGQVESPQLIAMDTMNFWIEGKRDSLRETLKLVNILLINEGEARQLTEEPSLVKAARKIFTYPLEEVFDPTGAGDTFAGGFMGYLTNTMDFSETAMRRATVMGSVMASFNVEDFSLNRIRDLEYREIENRYREFKKLAHFEDL